MLIGLSDFDYLVLLYGRCPSNETQTCVCRACFPAENALHLDAIKCLSQRNLPTPLPPFVFFKRRVRRLKRLEVGVGKSNPVVLDDEARDRLAAGVTLEEFIGTQTN